jgi:hypothetical protein
VRLSILFSRDGDRGFEADGDLDLGLGGDIGFVRGEGGGRRGAGSLSSLSSDELLSSE